MNLGTSLHWVSTKMKDKICLIEGDTEVPYSQLWKNIENLAKAFLNIGIKENDKVAIILPNCKEFIYSFYSLARINAISVPLGTYFTNYELDKIFKDCIPAAIIITYDIYKKNIQPKLDKNKLIIITDEPLEPCNENIFKFKELLTGFKRDGRLQRFSTSNNQIASINYTYRGLGEPLGAVLTHGNYHHGAIGYMRLTRVSTKQRVLLIIPISHIFTLVSCVIVPLLRGATVVIMKNFIPSHIFKAIKERKIDFIVGVPTIYLLLARNYERSRFDISSLKHGITGGSYLSKDIHQEIKEKMGIELLQGYGLTETMPITCNPRSMNKPDSLGVPGHEIKVKIEGGEILIKGPTVMKGYYNKNGMNTEYFKNGWFCTGDYGHIDKDGYVYFDGLKKGIVKVGGKTVDMKEIKDVLSSFPGVKCIELDVLEDDLWGYQIYAKVWLNSKKQITEQELRAYCKEKLANYKIPRGITIVRNLSKAYA